MRLHDSGPTNERGDPIGAFPVRVLLAAERRSAAVRPAKGLGAIVRCVNYDCVVGDAEVIKFFQELTNLAVMLDHSIRVDPQASLASRFRLQVGPDVHAGWIEPDEEGLLVVVGTVNEVDRRSNEFFIDSFLTLLGQWSGVLAFLLAPGAPAGIVARRIGGSSNAFQNTAWTEPLSEC